MATKYVLDTKAAQAISAYVILNSAGKHVATIRAHHTEGTCTVNVFDFADGGKGFQLGRATGYGYNKLNSALSGLSIQGVVLKEDGPEQLEKQGFKVIQAI